MTEKRRPEWWPPLDRKIDRETMPVHALVWDAAVEAGVKAVIDRLESLMGRVVVNPHQRRLGDSVHAYRFIIEELWQQLRKEAGLE